MEAELGKVPRCLGQAYASQAQSIHFGVVDALEHVALGAPGMGC